MEIDDRLSLKLVSSHDIANTTKSRIDNRRILKIKQTNQWGEKPLLNDRLKLMVFSVSQIRKSPTNFSDYVLILHLDQAGKDTQARRKLAEIWRWLPAKQVRESPSPIAEKGLAFSVLKIRKKRGKSIAAQDIISRVR